jgi:uncharacterized membrane protein
MTPVLIDGETVDRLSSGGVAARGIDINQDLTVVGYVWNEKHDPCERTPFAVTPGIWTNGELALLPLPDGIDFGYAVAVNASGAAIGFGYNLANMQETVEFFLWQDGEFATVPVAGDCPEGRGGRGISAIADDGTIGGTVCGEAAIWRDGEVETFAGVPDAKFSFTYDMNASGDLAGNAGFDNGEGGTQFRPMLWRDGEALALPLPDGVATGSASAINDDGVVAGFAGSGAAIWIDGELVELQPLIADLGFDQSRAIDVNNEGQILVTAGDSGTTEAHALLLTPTQ